MLNQLHSFARTRLAVYLFALFLGLPFTARALDQTSADALAASMLTASGRHCAIIAVPRCESGELVLSFWNKVGDSHLIVDGFESDPTLLASAQQKANALGLLGRNLYVRSGTLSANAYSMPYADHFVDLVVATGLADADLAGISYSEMERVLCVSGQAWVGRAASEGAGLTAAALNTWIGGTHALSTATVVSDATGTWAVITKINRLPNTYEGGVNVTNAGNRFYPDYVASWPTLPQWAAKPYGLVCSNATNKLLNWGMLAKICVGGGRMYGFDDNNPNGLCALRAQNGVFLWQRPGLNMYTAGGIQPFSGGVVYDNQVIDGETGATVATIPLPMDWTGTRSYLVSNDILYATGHNSSGVNTLFAYDLVNRATVYSQANIADNKTISYYSYGGMIGNLPCVVMAGGVIYVSCGTSYASGTAIYCYNASNGSKKWGPVTPPATIRNIEASPNGVLLQSGMSGTVNYYFLAVADGSLKWGPVATASPAGYSDIATVSALMNGREQVCAIGNGYPVDLLSGTISKATVGIYTGGKCPPGGSMMPAGFFGRRGGISGVLSSSSNIGVKINSSDPYASDCTDAPAAASGMIITKDKFYNCSCYGLFRGTSAQAPLGAFNPEQTAIQSERLQQGPAYGNVNAQVVPDALDWATHRANINRSGYVPVPVVTSSCVQLWKYTNPTPNTYDRDLNDDFCTYHDVTPPVTAGAYTATAGCYTYLAGSDGVVKCLDNATGNLVWSYPTGAWIFATPTIANGCVYVGSGDGCAYCLEAQTGRLVWRFRAAPAERRFNYYGHLISTWPILTGVLVHSNGNAYFASGMVDEYGVQVFAVNAMTGAIVWQNTSAGVCIDNRPGLARCGHMPGGYMTVVGNQLMIKESTRAYGSQLQRLDVYDLNTGAISAQDTSFPKQSQNGWGVWSGRQIGVMGNYVLGWGEDLHTEMEFEQYGGGTFFSKFDASGNPVRPFLQSNQTAPRGVASRITALVWDGTEAYLDDTNKYELSGTGGMTQYLDNVVANPPSVTGTPGVLCTTLCSPTTNWPPTTDSRWKPVSVGGTSAGSALTANCLIELSTAGDIGVMDRVSGSQYFHVSSGGEPYYHGIAVDRSGKIIVVNRNGDVVCFGTPTPVVVTPPTDVSGVDVGQQATFSVEAAGAGLTYQWQHNGVNMDGATGATYSIASIADSDAGSYSVVVTNTNGSVTSSSAFLSLSVATSMTSPTDGQMFSQATDGPPATAAIALSASASSLRGTITRVEFYASGTTLLGSASTAPYTYAWSAAPGTYTITSKAYDSTGKTGVSQPVSITVAGLAVHYAFNETSGTTAHDSSGNTNNGTVVTSTAATGPVWTQSLFNNGLQFNDNVVGSRKQGVTTGTISALGNSSFTVGFWVYYSGTSFNSQTPLHCVYPGGSNYLGIENWGTQPALWWYTTAGTQIITKTKEHAYTPGVWYHYALVATPAEVDWYIDGALFAAIQPPADEMLITSCNKFGLGNKNPVATNCGIYGMMDEVRIYDRALAAADIMAMYTTNVPYISPSPTLSLASPTDGAKITGTNSIPLAVTVGTCSHYPLTVNYYANGTLIGSSQSAPYGITWSNVLSGTYAVSAVGVDGLGQTVTTNTANVTFTYTPAPALNVAAGSYLNAQNVTVTCADPAAVIYYTTDGSTPTTSSPVIASGNSIPVNKTMVLKVLAIDPPMYQSPLQTLCYRIGGALAAGSGYSLILGSGTPLWACGYNGYGQLGDNTTTQRNSPVCISNSCSVNMLSIAAGYSHSLGVATDGAVWAWGYNYYGQLGNGTTTEQNAPVKLSGVTNALSVAAGAYHSLAVKQDGTVWAWGYNYYGQLGDSSTTQRISPVQSGSGVLTNIVAVTAGYGHSLALKSDGTVWAWGENSNGQLGDSSTTQRISPVQVTGLSGTVVAIAAGAFHSLAIKNDGTVWAWGSNTYGRLGDSSTTQRVSPVQSGSGVLTNIVAIAGGYYHTLALKGDGTVWAWGNNTYSQLGDGTTTQRSAPAQVSGLSNISAIAAGWYHSLALGNNGTFWAWGQNSSGQLGSGTTTNLTVPTATMSPSSPYVTFTSGSQSKSEAGGPITVTAQLFAPATGDVTVPFTIGGTAKTGTDYTIATSSPLTIPAGQTSASITITPINNTAYNGSRTIVVTMGTPVNATPGLTTVHTVTLTDDDPMPTLSFTTDSISQTESSGTAFMVAHLSATSGVTTTMPFTCLGSAVSGTDYTISTSPLTIAAGQTSGTISVTLYHRAGYQGDRTLQVNMGTLTNATKGSTASETLTITDVDPKPISITTPLAIQSVPWGQPATFSVVADGSSPVYQWSKNGTPISGATNASYTTPPTAVADNGAVFSVVISNAANSGTSSATLNVACNAPPVVSIFRPVDGAVLSPGPLDVVIGVNIQSSAGSLVEFYQGATKVGQTGGDPFTWTNVADGQYILTVKVTDNEGQTATSAPVSISVTGTATVSGTGYAAWVAAHGLSGESAGETAKLACDNVPNLIKYALGLSPTQACNKPTDGTNPGLPLVTTSGTTMSMTYQMDTSNTDITYTVETSPDMVTWTPVGTTSQNTLSTNGTVQTIQASVPKSGKQMFMRLRVTK